MYIGLYLTFQPPLDNFLGLLGRSLNKPVLPKQHHDFIGVLYSSGKEGQAAHWHKNLM